MKTEFSIRKKFTAVLNVTAAIGLFSVAPAGAADMTEQLKSAQGKEFDHHFLSMMIDHHKMGIDMAELADSNASSSELKQLARKMVSDQRRDISEMERMLKQTGKPPLQMSHDDPMMKDSMSDMQELKNAKGTEFDNMFASDMSKHHEMAIQMSEMAESRAQSADVKQMAAMMIKKQRQEISELRKFTKG